MRRRKAYLNIAFRVADEEGMPLLDLKDLQALLVWIGENRAQLSLRYGNVSTASIGAIQRRLLVLENQGGTNLFGEPALDLADLMRTDETGRGGEHPRLGQADGLSAPVCNFPVVVAERACLKNCPKSETPTNPSWSSSLTKRTCCLRMLQRFWSTRSSRWRG